MPASSHSSSSSCKTVHCRPSPPETVDIDNMPSAPHTPIAENPCCDTLTPPPTPSRPRRSRAPASDTVVPTRRGISGNIGQEIKQPMVDFKNSMIPATKERSSWEMTVPQPCNVVYQLQGSAASREKLGHGAWSTVYRTTERMQGQDAPLLTPPASPISSPIKPAAVRVFAIKTADRKDAHKVLCHEARILTYLHSSPAVNRFLVPFHGYDSNSHSLVMDAVPLNLDTYSKSSLGSARLNFSARTMFDPVCGTPIWRSLATQLINGLAWLHSESCIHGDIKPANILLRVNDADTTRIPTALYCDFSSSRIHGGSGRNESDRTQQLTALTPDFASPELLASLTTTSAVATTASDVYALGVTLVVAAIGASPYAGARLDVQKLSMAREGKVLDFARTTDQGSRIMKGKLVARCLKGALEKSVERRSRVEDWRRDVEDVIGEPS